MPILSQDFADMDGKKPASFLGRFDENGEQARRSRAWQSWIAHGRGPTNLLDELASIVDQLATESCTHGELDSEICSQICYMSTKATDIPQTEEVQIHPDRVRGHFYSPDVQLKYSYRPVRKGSGTPFFAKYEASHEELCGRERALSFKGMGRGHSWANTKKCLSPEMFSSDTDTPFLETVRRSLFPSLAEIRADLKTISFYGQDDLSLPSSIAVGADLKNLGTLVICPAVSGCCKGGAIRVHGPGANCNLELRNDRCIWAAYNSSCDHRISPVSEGVLVTIVYNLSAVPGASACPTAPQVSPQDATESIARALCLVLADPALPRRSIGFLMKHEYPWVASTEVGNLRGVDRALFNAVELLGVKAKLQPVILESVRAHPYEACEKSVRIYHAGWPFTTLLKRTLCSLLGGQQGGTVMDTLLHFLSDSLMPSREMPINVNWVAPPARPVGVALMVSEDERSTGVGNPVEYVMHYYHTALLVSSSCAGEKLSLTSFAKSRLPAETRFLALCRDGDVDTLDSLLANEYLALDGDLGRRALCLAVSRNHPHMVAALLDRKAVASAVTDHGTSVLRHAIDSKYMDCAHVLVDKGACIRMYHDLQQTEAEQRAQFEKAVLRALGSQGDLGCASQLLLLKQEELEAAREHCDALEARLKIEQQRVCSLMEQAKLQHEQLLAVFAPATAADRMLRRKAAKLRKRIRKHSQQQSKGIGSRCRWPMKFARDHGRSPQDELEHLELKMLQSLKCRLRFNPDRTDGDATAAATAAAAADQMHQESYQGASAEGGEDRVGRFANAQRQGTEDGGHPTAKAFIQLKINPCKGSKSGVGGNFGKERCVRMTGKGKSNQGSANKKGSERRGKGKGQNGQRICAQGALPSRQQPFSARAVVQATHHAEKRELDDPLEPLASAACSGPNAAPEQIPAETDTGIMSKNESLEAEELSQALCQSESDAVQEEQRALQKALLLSKEEAFNEQVYTLLRLTEHSQEVEGVLLRSQELEPCRQQVQAAGCELRPIWAGGAILMVPMTPGLYSELGLQLQSHHVLILAEHVGRLQAALKALPCRRRPGLRRDHRAEWRASQEADSGTTQNVCSNQLPRSAELTLHGEGQIVPCPRPDGHDDDALRGYGIIVQDTFLSSPASHFELSIVSSQHIAHSAPAVAHCPDADNSTENSKKPATEPRLHARNHRRWMKSKKSQ